MRVLNFLVTGGGIRKDPNWDFSGLNPNPDEVIRAMFEFTDEWNGTTKVAAFYDRDHRECEPKVLDKFDSCEIPAEAMKDFVFYIRIYGKKNSETLKTGLVAVCQDGR